MTNKLTRTKWSLLSQVKIISIVMIIIGFMTGEIYGSLLSGVGAGIYIGCDMEQQKYRGV